MLSNHKARGSMTEAERKRGSIVPAELEEGSWLVEGRLASSDGWLGSSTSPWDTTGSTDASALGLEYTHIGSTKKMS